MFPLIFRFPGGKFAGRIRGNAQNLDVSATLLDYLGIPKPGWIGGQSLLTGEPDPYRPIFGAARYYGLETKRGRFTEMDYERIGPPFFTMGEVTLTICHKWFEWDLRTGNFSSGSVAEHTSPCASGKLPDIQPAKRQITEHLRDNGYDTSGLDF